MNLLLLGLIAILQRPGMPPGQPAPPDVGWGGYLGGSFCCIGCPIICLVAGLVPLIGVCKVFAKAGQPAWAALVPIYNNYILCQIVKKPDWFIWTLIPCVNIYYMIMLTFETAKAFGKESGFAIGMLLLAPVFWCILGFSSAEYQLGRGGRKRRRVVDEDEDEEEEEERPRRGRARDEEDEEEEEEEEKPRRPSKPSRARDEDDEDEDRPRPKRRPRDDDD